MRTKKAIFFLFVFLSYVPVLAQVDTAWVRMYNGPTNGSDYATAMEVDGNGNIYVTGFSWDGQGGYDYATIKYDNNGDTLWVRGYIYGSTRPPAMGVDNAGNVYVTGSSATDLATIKYSPNGDTLWSKWYNGPGELYDIPEALVLDNSGNVYVTGTSLGSGTYYDYVTIKYASNGDILWVRRYNGPGNSFDGATALAVDSFGNVFVSGGSWGSGTYPDYATIKYAPNGDILWVRRYNGPGNYYDGATALAVDSGGNVYLTGYSAGTDSTQDYATIKYSPNGDIEWSSRYSGPMSDNDRPDDLAVDRYGNVYVTGSSRGGGTLSDYATIKYAPNGDTLWVRRYEGPGKNYDNASALAVDSSGNVYVTGGSFGSGTLSDFATIKYGPDGDTVWVRRYNGPGNDADGGVCLALDSSMNLYVAGSSWGTNTSSDYAIIKYVQFTCVAKAGDANGDNKVLLQDIVAIVNFLFRGAPAPNPSCRADANADGNVLLTDIVYLINSIFRSGPAPQKSRECCL